MSQGRLEELGQTRKICGRMGVKHQLRAEISHYSMRSLGTRSDVIKINECPCHGCGVSTGPCRGRIVRDLSGHSIVVMLALT